MTTAKDPRRQLQGAVSKELGKRFEERLNDAFAFYRYHGSAFVEKTPEPTRFIRWVDIKKRRFLAVFEKKAQPDYKGVTKGGRAVVFEAKFTEKVQMKQDRVTPEQADFLDRHQALGARCYILAGFASGAVYRLPWSVWRNMKKVFGRKYITEDDAKIVPYLVQTARDGTLLLLD